MVAQAYNPITITNCEFEVKSEKYEFESSLACALCLFNNTYVNICLIHKINLNKMISLGVVMFPIIAKD